MKTETNTHLFNPYDLGKIKLSNRMVIAPLTRCRAINQNLPNDLMVEYYDTELWGGIRKIYTGTPILCGSYDKEKAIQAIEDGKGDLIAFCRDYIGNPDLFERFKNDYPLTERKRDTWYGDGAVGYTDYPFYTK